MRDWKGLARRKKGGEVEIALERPSSKPVASACACSSLVRMVLGGDSGSVWFLASELRFTEESRWQDGSVPGFSLQEAWFGP